MNSTQPADFLPLIVVIFAIGLLPFAAMMISSYTKIVVVLGLLRNALGVQQVPPNMVLNGLAIIISAYIMMPLIMDTADLVKKQNPAQSSAQQAQQVIDAAKEPIRKFLDKHAHEREKAFFLKSAFQYGQLSEHNNYRRQILSYWHQHLHCQSLLRLSKLAFFCIYLLLWLI
jgi:type III secretion protein R